MLEAGIGFKHEVVVDSARGGERLPLVTFHKWEEFTEREQEIYIQALLEAWSFTLFGYSGTKEKQPPKEFSAFTACAEGEEIASFRRLPDVGYFLGDIDKSAVEHFFNQTPIICEKYIDKGDGSWRPVKIISKKDWGSFSDKEKKTYLTGYIDLSYFFTVRMVTGLSSTEKYKSDKEALKFLDGLKKDQEDLEKCMNRVGIDGVYSQMRQKEIEWQYPLSWSAASALGNTCKH